MKILSILKPTKKLAPFWTAKFKDAAIVCTAIFWYNPVTKTTSDDNCAYVQKFQDKSCRAFPVVHF